MKSVSKAALAASLCVWAGSALAQAPSAEELAAKFGAREAIRSVSLSPKGDKIVVIGNLSAGGEAATVVDLASSKMIQLLASRGGDQQLHQCNFALENRVICEVVVTQGSRRTLVRRSRLIVVGADRSNLEMLSDTNNSHAYYTSNYGGSLVDLNAPGHPTAVLLDSWSAPEWTTGSHLGSTKEGLGVEEVDLETMRRVPVEKPRDAADRYVSDGMGHVRVMELGTDLSTGNAANKSKFLYRPSAGGNWSELSTVTTTDTGLSIGFSPVAVDPVEDVAYGFDEKDGFTALFKRSLDGSGKTTLVLARQGVDVDRLITIGRRQRIVGASYAGERRTEEYFDPELARLRVALGRALSGGETISIVDADEGEKNLVLFASSDVDPGAFYSYEKATHELGKLFPARPELAGITMGQMKSVTYTAADGTQVPAYLTLPPGSDGKNLPAIVMPHGGPEARDEWGFDWLVQFFAVRGYAVLQPEFRGSTGFGTRWFQHNGFQSWRTAVGDVDDAGRWLVRQGIAAPGKLAIVGWSYGGYAALQSQVLDPDLFKAVVAVAPVTDLDVLRSESVGTYDAEVEDRRIGHGPHVEEGSPARHADRFRAPVLMFHGENDSNVGVAESRLMADRLKGAGKSVELVTFPGLDHQLDSAGARTTLLAKSDQFLRRAMGL